MLAVKNFEEEFFSIFFCLRLAVNGLFHVIPVKKSLLSFNKTYEDIEEAIKNFWGFEVAFLELKTFKK